VILKWAIILGISFFVFIISNALGGLSLRFGYTSMQYEYKREQNPGFNFLFKVISPVLIGLAIAFVIYAIGLKTWLIDFWCVVSAAWIIRLLYNLIFDKARLINWQLFFAQFFTSSLIAYSVYHFISPSPKLLFPSRDNLVSEIWLIVILFLYRAMDDLKVGEEGSRIRKKRYMDYTFKRLKQKFGKAIAQQAASQEIEILAYAIMIKENFNRPAFARTIERVLGGIRGKGTYGIMQVTSDRPITDLESTKRGIQILNDLFAKVKQITEIRHPEHKDNGWVMGSMVTRVAWHYNNSVEYSEDIHDLYVHIQKSYFIAPKPLDPDDRFDAFYHSPFSLE